MHQGPSESEFYNDKYKKLRKMGRTGYKKYRLLLVECCVTDCMLSDKPSQDYSRIDVVLQDVSGLGNFRTVYRNVG